MIAIGAKGAGSRVPDVEAAIIGAGPYGLSAAAHLHAKGLKVHGFGTAMDFWADQMPAGMLLRSPRPASNIADPDSALTLGHYEAAFALQSERRISLNRFVDYGRWFQRQIDAPFETTSVSQISRENDLFRLALRDGRSLTSRRVVVAAGISDFAQKPNVFGELPAALVSHCYEGRSFHDLTGKRVAVIGAGQSALESAALLEEAGAHAEVIARIPRLRWIGQHPWLHRLGPLTRMLYSEYDVGPAGISRLVSWPGLVTLLPSEIRDRIRRRAVRSAGAPWLQPRLQGTAITLGRTVVSATQDGHQVRLKLDDGTERLVDQVLLGTGYRVVVSRYRFLAPSLLAQMRLIDGYPVLDNGLCSSVPGLHFVGATAAKTFGPLLCFVAGTKFASSRLSAYVGRNRVTSA